MKVLNKKGLLAKASKGLKKTRHDIIEIMEAALNSADAFKAITENVKLKQNYLFVEKDKYDLNDFENIYVVGGGKAVFEMAKGIEKALGEKITKGHVNVLNGKKGVLKKITFSIASHPFPDRQGVKGAKKIREIVLKATEKDLVIALISGGGSAMMPLPPKEISLKEKNQLTKLLLKSNATIHEINVVRKHISELKGGQLAKYVFPATLIAVYVSDIVGDDYGILASGPAFPDKSTFRDAINILKRKNLWSKTPLRIKKYLENGSKNLQMETPKKLDKFFRKVHNYTLLNHLSSLGAAVKKAKSLGYNVFPLAGFLKGEARKAGTAIISIGNLIKQHGIPVKTPAIVIASGETTVNVKGKGKGGRNQELVLSGLQNIEDGMVLASFGTDGIDGITPKKVAGAIADNSTKINAQKKNLDAYRFLENNDSYNFFNKLNGHIITGPTGTNVGDLAILAVV